MKDKKLILNNHINFWVLVWWGSVLVVSFCFLIRRRLDLCEVKMSTRKFCWIKDLTTVLKLVQGYWRVECSLRGGRKTFWYAFFEKKRKRKQPSTKPFSDMYCGGLFVAELFHINKPSFSSFHSFGHRTDAIHQSLYHRHSQMVLIKRRNPNQNWWSTL